MTKDHNDYLKTWLFRANEDIAVIEKLFESDPELFASTICFHAQQAVEKFLKAFLVFHNIDFPKTHDLDYLLLECKKIDARNFDIDLGSLTDFGVSIRYPDDFYLPDKDETAQYRGIALKVKIVIENIIKI
ncbi:MAG: HEPN domain-containing protein [Bacteroidales bacterium]|nr:HEPN domain-containing protein [Bacteroidales bacterium]